MHYWANCSDYYGATIHYLNEKFDDGNILVRGKLKMLNNEGHDDVFIRTAELCGHLLVSALLLVEMGDPGFKVKGTKRYFFKMSPEEFENHRKMNEELISQGKEIVLTPHKCLE
jgi:methionyl-tRNA formyltransferase